VIALSLCGKPHRLTGKEFRFLRTTMNMSQGGIAKLLGVTEQSVSLWERTGKVPKAPDTLTRLAFLAKHDGNAKISSVIDRINTVERICHQRIVAKESAKGWTSTLKDEDALAA
jgi:transcriptional regulator with XRE-family HTH domain